MMQSIVKSTTRVLIVDDHPVVLSGCRSLFASDPTIRIDEAADAKSGHRAFMQKKPDVTVIDINLPDVSGFAHATDDDCPFDFQQEAHCPTKVLCQEI